MASYKAPLREINFVLDDVLKIGRLAELEPFKEATPDTLAGLIDGLQDYGDRGLVAAERWREAGLKPPAFSPSYSPALSLQRDPPSPHSRRTSAATARPPPDVSQQGCERPGVVGSYARRAISFRL